MSDSWDNQTVLLTKFFPGDITKDINVAALRSVEEQLCSIADPNNMPTIEQLFADMLRKPTQSLAFLIGSKARKTLASQQRTELAIMDRRISEHSEQVKTQTEEEAVWKCHSDKQREALQVSFNKYWMF